MSEQKNIPDTSQDIAIRSVKMFEQNLRQCILRTRSDVSCLIAEEARKFLEDPRDDKMMDDIYPGG